MLIWHTVNAAQRKDYDETRTLGDSLMSIQRGTVFWEAIVAEWLATQSAMRGQMAEARQQWGRSVNADASRDLAGQYLFRTSRRSMIETMVRLDPSVG